RSSEVIALRRQRVQPLPDLLGHKRNDRVQQPAKCVEHSGENALRIWLRVSVTEPSFYEFEIPIAEITPGEITEATSSFGELELIEIGSHFLDRAIQAIENPAILNRKRFRIKRCRRVAFKIHERQPRGIPELIGEIAALLEPLGCVDHAPV